MAAIKLQTIPSFYAKNSEKKSFLQKLMKNALFMKTTASPITTIRRVLEPFVNITLYYLEKLRDCYRKLDTFYFNYQQVDCLYTLFKYRFNEKIIAKSGNIFDNVQKAISFKQRIRENPAFTQNSQRKVSLYLQIHMKNTLFVKTTASPTTTTRRVFYPLVNIILYYLETLKNY